MNRRSFLLKSTGAVTAFSALAGCTSEASTSEPTPTPTPEPAPTIISGSGKFPKFSGTATITGESDFWAFKFEMEDWFILNYTVENRKASKFDFDVFVFRPDEFAAYEAKVAGGSGSPNSIYKASEEGVRDKVEKSVKLNGGTCYLVVDNTDIGDAGDWGSEEARKVRIEIETDEVATPTATETPTETESPTPEPTPTAEDGRFLMETFMRQETILKGVEVELDGRDVEVEYRSQASNMSELGHEMGIVLGSYTSAVKEGYPLGDMDCRILDRDGFPQATFYCLREWVGDEDVTEKVFNTLEQA